MHGAGRDNAEPLDLARAPAVEEQQTIPAGVLAVIAVDDPTTDGFADALDQQLQVVRNWWAPVHGTEAGFSESVLLKPHERHDIEVFLHEQRIRETPKNTPLVFYIASHGELSSAQRHYLRLPATRDGRLPATAILTTEVITAALSSPSEHVLVLLNACHAGGIGPELGLWQADIQAVQGGSHTVVVATETDLQVQALEFATILDKAYRRLQDIAEITRPYLTVGEFIGALETATDELNLERGDTGTEDELPGPRAALSGRQTRPLPTLPNPGYRPQRSLIHPSRSDVSTPYEELEQWTNRAEPGTPGWYFSGRPHLNSTVAAFLRQPAGVLIVCGATASGKSSLLARTVTLSEPAVRQTPTVSAALAQTPAAQVPDADTIDVAITARQRSCTSLLEAIATRLPGQPAGEPPAGTDPDHHWRDHIKRSLSQPSDRPLTLIIDALDESLAPAAVIRDVLEPLVAHARGTTRSKPKIPAQVPLDPTATPPGRPLRLVLAVRSSIPTSTAAAHPLDEPQPDLLGDLTAAFPRARLVRADEPGITDDIAAYTHALLDEALWAQDEPDQRTTAANTIAASVGHSFLDARLAAEQLIQAGPGPIDDPDWPHQLQMGTLSLFAQDIRQLREHDPDAEALITLLCATAFSLGRGLPRADIWPAVARALSPRPLTNVDSQIGRLLRSHLAGYLTQDIEDDRRVYRPAHEQLARLLRLWPTKGDAALNHPERSELPDPANQQAHDRITATLADLARKDPGGQPPPYLARHLSQHAVQAHALDDDHLPPTLLPWTTGDTVRGQLHHPHPANARRTWLTAWAAVEPYVQHADLPSRCSSLQLAHTVLTSRAPDQEPVQLLGSCLRVLWSQWALPVNVLAATRQHTSALAAAHGHGRPYIAIGSETGSIDLIDARTGSTLGDQIHAHVGTVTCLQVIDDGPRTLLASGSTDGDVRVWDATNRLPVHRFARHRNNWVAGLVGYRTADGEIALIAVNSDGDITQWREHHGERPIAQMAAHPLETSAFTILITTTGDGAPHHLVCAGATLRIWVIATFELLATHALHAAVRILAATPEPSRIVTGHQDGTVTVWDLEAGQNHRFAAGDQPVTALICLTLNGRHIAAVAQATRIDLRDLDDGQLLGTLNGHTDNVTALSTTTDTAPPTLISCARDDTIRTWSRQALLNALTQHDQPPAALAATAIQLPDAGLRLAVSYRDSRIQTFTPTTNQPGPTLDLAHHAAHALAWAPATDGPPDLLYAAPDHTIRTWNPDTPQADHPPLAGHLLAIRSIAACRTPAGRPLAVSGSDDHTVRLWDLTDHELLKTWRHHYSVRAVAAAPTGPDHALQIASGSADGTVRLWTPNNTKPQGVLHCRQGFIHALAIDPDTPDGPLLATAGDNTLRLWNLHDHTPRSDDLRGHTDIVEALTAWTTPQPTPRSYVASAARDGTIRIWDTATSRCILLLATGTRVRTLTAHPRPDQPAALMTIAGEAGALVVELQLDRL
ncbi:hypothetical protein AB0454_31270 [Streptomyces sp. NPDC093509]|uniref:hypothetical protein n=1 Tax=Streptomyces sp. NPDC093509 TaxID=3154982 RepID=UPI00344C539C